MAVIVQKLLYLHMCFLKELIFITRHRVIVNECIAMKISTWIASANMNLFLFLQQMSMSVICEGDLTEKKKVT